MCPGGVLCSQFRAGPEPCRVLSASSHCCHCSLCCIWFYSAAQKHSGCDRHSQLPCLLSASSDNLCKGKTHQISPCLQMPSDGTKQPRADEWRQSSSSGVPWLCLQRRTSSICRKVPEFSQPPCRHVSPFTVAVALAAVQLHCLLCGVSHCHSDT